ncbi:unnamed protein product [Hanseniaspora opuntiae]
MKSVYLIIASLFTCVFGTSIFTLDVPDGSPIPGNTPLEQCEISENHILDIQSLIMEPQPPKNRRQLGYNFDLCDLLYENKDDLGLECPVSPGTYELFKEVEIPPQAPAGKYIVLVKAFNGDEQKIGCVTGEITLGR